MRNKFILAPSMNGSELLRTLARKGKNTLALRIMGSAELAEYALMCCGKPTDKRIISFDESVSLIQSASAENDYFGSCGYEDSALLAEAVNSVRMLAECDEEKTLEATILKGTFAEKNTAVFNVYRSYMALLEKNNCIDNIGLIRLAIKENAVIEGDFFCLAEAELTPLEKKLLDTVSGGNYSETSVAELAEADNIKIHADRFFRAYGASNEAEATLNYILKNNIPLDSCTIAVSSPSVYAQLFFELSCKYNIPVSFGCGIPVTNSYPASLLRLLNIWSSTGYNGIDSLNDIIFSSFFNRKAVAELFSDCEGFSADILRQIIETAGSLRLSLDPDSNKRKISNFRSFVSDSHKLEILRMTEKLFSQFENGLSYIIKNYSVIRKNSMGRIDRSARNAICDAIDSYSLFSENTLGTDIIPTALSISVCSENSRDGALHITSFRNAVTSIRENLFILGLGSSDFPGTPSENHIIHDDDYLLFENGGEMYTSYEKINRRKNELFSLIKTACAFDNDITVSYSDYMLSDLKEDNASSVIYELFKEINGEYPDGETIDKAFEDVPFFASEFSASRLIGKAYNEGLSIEPVTAKTDSDSDSDSAKSSAVVKTKFSPTAIEQFFSCPRRFFLSRILGLNEPDCDDPFEVISARELGTIVHGLMELLAEKKLSEADFIAEGYRRLDEFFAVRPPIYSADAQKLRVEFIEILTNAFRNDPRNQVISAEEYYTADHPSGITLFGKPDRIEKTSDGKILIADYKTGRKVTHIDNDPVSCIQVLIYAYMLEKQGYDVSGGEYRYLRNNVTVKLDYNDSARKALDNLLCKFKNALDNCDFPSDKNSCKYCGLASACNAVDCERSDV